MSFNIPLIFIFIDFFLAASNNEGLGVLIRIFIVRWYFIVLDPAVDMFSGQERSSFKNSLNNARPDSHVLPRYGR